MKSTRFLVSFLSTLWLLPLLWVHVCQATTTVPTYGEGKDHALRLSASRQLNAYQSQNIRAFIAGRVVPIDTLRVLALQIQFSDSLMGGQPGSLRPEVRDSTFFANELEHVAQYYEGASRGNTVIRWTVTSKLYNLPQPMGYYGNDDLEDVRGVEMMQSAIDSADADEDFSLYDTFMLIHAGAGQETDILDNSRVQVFSTFFDRTDINAAFTDSTVMGLATSDSLGGKPFLVDNFMIAPANASQDGIIIGTLGIWCFEVGSRLGLLPLFDSTPSGFPDSRGVGDFDLMSYGLFNAQGFIPGFPSAFNRVINGWVEPLLVDTGAAYRIQDINLPDLGDPACLKIPITESEYFLVVNRVHDTNFDSLFTFTDLDSNRIPDNEDPLAGAEFDFFLTDFTNPFIVKPDPNAGGVLRRFVTTGSGVYVWHVDENVIRQNFEAGRLPNDFVSRKGVDLEEADGIQDMDRIDNSFSFGSHFDSFREGNNGNFGPGTKPNSASNSGANTGISILTQTAADSFMLVSVEVAKPFSEVRTRWLAPSRFQPVTAFDLDGAGAEELLALADTGHVYAFNADGSEFVDRDGEPATIEPYFSTPAAVWVGAPAFGDIDGGGDLEIVAAAESGTLLAWKRDGTEVFDGDNDAGTQGVLYEGAALAAPPMLVDVDGDALDDIAIVERSGDSLVVAFVDGTGASVLPIDPLARALWPVRIQAQACAPLAYGALGRTGNDTEGVVIAWADTIRAIYGLSYYPLKIRAGSGLGVESVTLAPRDTVKATFPPLSYPAVGDLDGDGFEEAVVTLPDGRLAIFAPARVFSQTSSPAADATPPVEPNRLRIVGLRTANPSAPALGDADGNGTLEIALYDETHFYLFENNGRLRTNWPQPIRATRLGSFPRLVFPPPLSSPLIANIDGEGQTEIIYPLQDGLVFAFRPDGTVAPDFPRAAPAGPAATPTLRDLDGDGVLSLVSLGSIGLLETVDSVSDTIRLAETMVLSIQSLPGSSAQSQSFWSMYQHNHRRQGRVTETNPLLSTSVIADPNSFIVYPNPVRGGAVHARIVLNTSADVEVEIYNLEGEQAVARRFLWNNTGSAIQTPFDEAIDIGELASGIYLLRMFVKSSSGSETFLKTFAVLR